ncbi:MAG: HEAT repeat domain-containing protein, partial [Planctomycetota bacterium]
MQRVGRRKALICSLGGVAALAVVLLALGRISGERAPDRTPEPPRPPAEESAAPGEASAPAAARAEAPRAADESPEPKPPPPAPAPPANWIESLERAFGNGELSEDELLDVIRTLHAFAEAGAAPLVAEDGIASLLTEDARGKILSRWCFRALARISGESDKYVGQYLAAAGWLYTNPVPVKAGEIGRIGGPGPDMVGPEMPEELRAASRLAWITGVEAAMRLLVGSEDAERTRRVTEVLRNMGAPEDVMVPCLAKVVLDRTVRSWTREKAADLIGTYGNSAASMDSLLAGLKVEDARVRGACARSLGKLGSRYDFYGSLPGRHPRPKEAVAALIAVMRDPDASARGGAMSGLADMGCEAAAAVDALVEIVESDTDPCRGAAASALGKIGGALRGRRPEAYARVARAAVPAIIKALRIEPMGHRNNRIVSCAAKSIGSFGRAASPAVPELRRLLRYEAPKSAAKAREMVSFR